MSTPYIVLIVILVVVVISIRQVNQYEKGVKFMLGKYIGTKNAGWRLVFPVIQSMMKIDMRVKAVDVPLQEAITKDNVSAKINAVIYYKVIDASKAFLEVENFKFAVNQLAQTTMRNVVGEVSLDALLGERDRISGRIREIVDKLTDPWGIKVSSVDLKDVVLPENLKRTIGKQAEAEREKRSVIIKAEGEVLASKNMSKAAETLARAPGALHLRTLQSINDISSDQSNTVVFAVPLEILNAFKGFSEGKKEKK